MISFSWCKVSSTFSYKSLNFRHFYRKTRYSWRKSICSSSIFLIFSFTIVPPLNLKPPTPPTRPAPKEIVHFRIIPTSPQFSDSNSIVHQSRRLRMHNKLFYIQKYRFTMLNHWFTTLNHWFTSLKHWFRIVPACGINCFLAFWLLKQ